ncbi:unnamed protein product [Calypogeia fissa]
MKGTCTARYAALGGATTWGTPSVGFYLIVWLGTSELAVSSEPSEGWARKESKSRTSSSAEEVSFDEDIGLVSGPLDQCLVVLASKQGVATGRHAASGRKAGGWLVGWVGVGFGAPIVQQSTSLSFLSEALVERLTEETQDTKSKVGFAGMPKMLDMLDPLNGVEHGGAEDDEDEYETPTRDNKENGPPISEEEQASAVLSWSVDKVKKWLETSVSFEQDRIQEFVHFFEREGVDGLGLLTLQRSHRACVGMSDTEWLLLKASRRRLLTHGEKGSLSQLNKRAVEEVLGVLTPPSTPPASRTQNGSHNGFGLRDSHDNGLFGSPRKWSIPGLRWGQARDDQFESLREEVMSLRGEIVGAEERETTLQAQLDHLDEVLRTSQLSGYIHTRTRWTALPGEPPILDETDVDDWMLRFLVLRGSTICFYLRATDLRPQGTILLQEIVDAGPIPRKMHHKGDRRWSAFQITTCHGLRLECASMQKIQIDSWLTSIGTSFVKIGRQKAESLDTALSGAWLKILPVDTEECLSQEFDLFGGKA